MERKRKQSHKNSLQSAISTVIGMLIVAVFVMPTQASAFLDTQDHWADAYVQQWADYGVVAGAEGYFRPDDSITRGEMAVIVDKIMGYQVKSTQDFQDLPADFYHDAMLKLNAAGVMAGYEGYIRPLDAITRQEAAVVLASALHISYRVSDVTTGYPDDATIDLWAKGVVEAMTELGLISGRQDGTFDPKANITRGEVMTILSKAIPVLVQGDHLYNRYIEGSVVVNKGATTLTDLEIEGDLILSEGIANGNVYLNQVTVHGSIFVKGGGSNSIYFNNVTVEGETLIQRVNQPVRVILQGNTTLPFITINTSATLEAVETNGIYQGTLGKVSVEGGQEVTIKGPFETIVCGMQGIYLNVEGDIGSLEARAGMAINGVTFHNGGTFTAQTLPGVEVEVQKETYVITPRVYVVDENGSVLSNMAVGCSVEVVLSAQEESRVYVKIREGVGFEFVRGFTTVGYAQQPIDLSSGEGTFWMPSSNVTVTAYFKKTNTSTENGDSLEEEKDEDSDSTPEEDSDATPEGDSDATPEGDSDATPEGDSDATPEGDSDATPEEDNVGENVEDSL